MDSPVPFLPRCCGWDSREYVSTYRFLYNLGIFTVIFPQSHTALSNPPRPWKAPCHRPPHRQPQELLYNTRTFSGCPLDDRPLGGRVREREAQAVNRVLQFSHFVFCTNTKAPGLAVPGAMEKIGYSEVSWPCTQQAAGRWSATWPWHLPASCRPQQRRGGRR